MSPLKNTEGCHSCDVRVFEATYFVAVLTPGHMSAWCGQYGAQISKVLRPNNRSNGMFICLFMAVPITSSEYGACHPPYAKPPLVSSSGPPPACMTPSRVTKSSAITFLMTKLLQQLATFRVKIAQMFERRKLDYGSKHLSRQSTQAKSHRL